MLNLAVLIVTTGLEKVNCETVKLLDTWQNSPKDSLVELEIECNYVNLID